MNRTLLIGCGAVAEAGHVPAMVRHPAFEIAAVCDVRPQRSELLAKHAGGVRHHLDWRVALESDRFAAAVLALPPEASADVAVECLRCGLAVLDEKPLAATLADGQRVARAVVESRGVYQVGFVLRYGDWVSELATLAQRIGTPARIRVAIYDELLNRADAEHFNRINGFLRTSSAMTHEGSHVVDYTSIWNDSPPTRIRAIAHQTESDLAGPNLWQATIDQADGSVIDIEIGWLLPELPPCTVSIDGPVGRLMFSPATGAGRWEIDGESGSLNLSPARPEWDRQYDTFAAAIARGHATIATVDDGLRALEVTNACEQSARTNEDVSAVRSAAGRTS